MKKILAIAFAVFMAICTTVGIVVYSMSEETYKRLGGGDYEEESEEMDEYTSRVDNFIGIDAADSVEVIYSSGASQVRCCGSIQALRDYSVRVEAGRLNITCIKYARAPKLTVYATSPKLESVFLGGACRFRSEGVWVAPQGFIAACHGASKLEMPNLVCYSNANITAIDASKVEINPDCQYIDIHADDASNVDVQILSESKRVSIYTSGVSKVKLAAHDKNDSIYVDARETSKVILSGETGGLTTDKDMTANINTDKLKVTRK